MNFYLYGAIAFLVGGLPFGLIIGYICGRGDIRRQGSGNIGATNVLRVIGPIAAVLALLGDVGKGIGAVWLGRIWFNGQWPVSLDTALITGGVLAILGHVFSPYLKFRGGKGVNTALGVFLMLAPVESLIALAAFIIIVICFRFVSLASMSGVMVFAGVLWIEKLGLGYSISWLLIAIATLLALFILFTHRSNIGRLIAGTESRLQLRRSAS